MMVRAIALLALLVFAGCGSASGSQSTPQPQSASKPAESYRARVTDCLTNVGYNVSHAGNALRVQRPAGELIANVQTFPTSKAARRFESKLLVDGRGGGRGVAVFLRDADDTAKAVVADCLTP